MPYQERVWQMLGQIAAGVERTNRDTQTLREDVATIQQRQAVIVHRLERIESLDRQTASRIPGTPWSRPFLAILALIGAVAANVKAEMIANLILALLAHK